jgi:ATP-binding cassette subfamily B protein
VFESQPQVQNRAGALAEFQPKGRVVFENVSFSYEGQDADPVLKGVSFTAEPGQTVALLGTTGAGKSSLVHLIPRFYDVTSGNVTIDGCDIRDIDQVALRRNIGVALQEAVLFSGTIRDNIRYGRPEASDEEVIAAAKAAQAHDFIQSMPEGYDRWTRRESFRRTKTTHRHRPCSAAQACHPDPRRQHQCRRCGD